MLRFNLVFPSVIPSRWWISGLLALPLIAACDTNHSNTAAAAPPTPPPASSYSFDTGFRPLTDGFAFANYGGETEAQNLDVARMRELFGDQVCASAAGDDCKLTPPGKHWLQGMDRLFDAGHCEGMAVLSALFFKNVNGLKPSQFGAETVAELTLPDNEKLQTEIAKWMATQMLAPTNTQIFGKDETPQAVLDRLLELWKSGDMPVLHMARADVIDGHVVLPYRMTTDGTSRVELMVYDPDYPGVERTVNFNVADSTWNYEFFISESGEAYGYDGTATSGTLSLVPNAPRLGQQVCTFCASAAATSGTQAKLDVTANNPNSLQNLPSAVRVMTDADYIKAANCPAGNQAIPPERSTGPEGFTIPPVDGTPWRCVPTTVARTYNTSGGVLKPSDSMFDSFVGARGSTEPTLDPSYTPLQMQVGFPSMKGKPGPTPVFLMDPARDSQFLIGNSLDVPKTVTAQFVGAGFELSVYDIQLDPGQSDLITVPGGTASMTYTTQSAESPDLTVGFEAEGADFELSLLASASDDQMRVTLAHNKAEKTFEYIVSGVLEFDLLMFRTDDGGEEVFSHIGETYTENDRIVIDYGTWQGNGTPLTIRIDDGNDGVIDETIELADAE